MTSSADPDPAVIDRMQFVPHYLVVLANGVVWSQSRFYLEHYGCGINEVRLVTVLAHSPGLTAQGLCKVLLMNKSIVSRSLAEIVAKGYVGAEGKSRDRRYRLTATGLALNAKIVRIAFQRERRLLEGFTPREREALLGYLGRLLNNLDQATDPQNMAADAGIEIDSISPT